MRSGGKGMWGRGPALYKHNYLKKERNNDLRHFYGENYDEIRTASHTGGENTTADV
jgi:hypothetical protein